MNVNYWAPTRARILALMLVVAGEASAQMGGVQGKVVDENGNPLEGVEITLELKGGGRIIEVTTNAKGDFAKGGIRPGTYTITYSLDGYEEARGEIQITMGRPEYMGTLTLAKLPEGTLTEEAHERAQQALVEAQAASGEKDYQATIESLKEFIELVPDSAEAYFNLAAAYEQIGDSENALVNYQKAVELKPDLYDAWVAIGEIYSSLKKWREGMDALGKALELQPNQTVVRFNYGAYAFNAGDMGAAQEAFEKLIESNPSHAMGHYQLGIVMVSQGQNEEAAVHLEKYLELEPEGANAATAKELLNTLKNK